MAGTRGKQLVCNNYWRLKCVDFYLHVCCTPSWQCLDAGQLLIVLYDRSCEHKFIDLFVSGNDTEADEGVGLRHAQALTVSSASEIIL
jgi:hypothetical protein